MVVDWRTLIVKHPYDTFYPRITWAIDSCIYWLAFREEDALPNGSRAYGAWLFVQVGLTSEGIYFDKDNPAVGVEGEFTSENLIEVNEEDLDIMIPVILREYRHPLFRPLPGWE